MFDSNRISVITDSILNEPCPRKRYILLLLLYVRTMNRVYTFIRVWNNLIYIYIYRLKNNNLSGVRSPRDRIGNKIIDRRTRVIIIVTRPSTVLYDFFFFLERFNDSSIHIITKYICLETSLNIIFKRIRLN